MTNPTPFELDIAEQPEALRRLADATATWGTETVGDDHRSIVLTGMGSSDFAAIPTWRRLVAAGHDVWQIDTGELLDNPGIVRSDSLLVITSQSGASGEVVELLRRLEAGAIRAGRVVGITDNASSPLAVQADLSLALHSGPEATVSTKSYLNTLGVHRWLGDALLHESTADFTRELRDTAAVVEHIIGDVDLEEVAVATVRHPARRLAFVGVGEHLATANFASLITKESSKVAAEGYTTGQFRHGPYELAGDGLTAVFFGMSREPDTAGMARLAGDLVSAGSRVVLVGDHEIPGALTVPVPTSAGLAQLAANSVVAELFAVSLARANGVVPGEFLYGSKITTTV